MECAASSCVFCILLVGHSQVHGTRLSIVRLPLPFPAFPLHSIDLYNWGEPERAPHLCEVQQVCLYTVQVAIYTTNIQLIIKLYNICLGISKQYKCELSWKKFLNGKKISKALVLARYFIWRATFESVFLEGEEFHSAFRWLVEHGSTWCVIFSRKARHRLLSWSRRRLQWLPSYAPEK